MWPDKLPPVSKNNLPSSRLSKIGLWQINVKLGSINEYIYE